MNNIQKWDILSRQFDTYEDKFFHGAADNIYTAWPIILNYIRHNFRGNKNNLRALDYGCGTGMFCKKLSSLGFETYGIDVSPKMISISKKNLSNEIRLSVGNFNDAFQISKKKGRFYVISSVMTFQFIKNIEKCAEKLVESLNKDGYLIFAVHNPEKLDERKIKDKIKIANQMLPIFKRTSQFYDDLFRPLGLVKTLEVYPKTSNRFLRFYKQKDSLKIPKYMILAYRKK